MNYRKYANKTLQELTDEGHYFLLVFKETLQEASRRELAEAIEEEIWPDIERIIKRLRPADPQLGLKILYKIKELKNLEHLQVSVDIFQGTASFTCEKGSYEPYHLIGDEGEEFMREAYDLFLRCGNISIHEAAIYLALPHMEKHWK